MNGDAVIEITVFVIGWLVLSFMVYGLALALIDRLIGTHMSCKQFGWHNGKGGAKTFDGCSFHATCSKCGKEVMQDGQGNWF